MDKANIENLKKDISDICRNSGRRASDVKIIGASKYTDSNGIARALKLGIEDFGENRAEALAEKHSLIGNKVTWHFIGHLQSRKAKIVVPIAEYIHSCDSPDILEVINRQAEAIQKIQKVLIEVNVSGEESKYGIKPEELPALIIKALDLKNIMVCGLMTMAPLSGDEILIRKVFKSLRLLKDKIAEKTPDSARNIKLFELSMGMSNDYKIAIEEGATMIRIGSLIFL